MSLITSQNYVESLTSLEDYIIAFEKADRIQREIYIIRGVFMKFGEEGLKELAASARRSLDEFYDCASLEWFSKNLRRKKHGWKKKAHITAGESIAPIIEKKLKNPYRKMDGWDMRRTGVRNDFC